MYENEKKEVLKIAEWVALTYGIEAIKDMMNPDKFKAYVDAYNEAFAESVAKLQKNEDTCNVLAAQVYNEIRK